MLFRGHEKEIVIYVKAVGRKTLKRVSKNDENECTIKLVTFIRLHLVENCQGNVNFVIDDVYAESLHRSGSV